MERFFAVNKIIETGNPVRKEVTVIEGKKELAQRFFGLDSSKKTVLVIGGSLGARTLNEAILNHVEEVNSSDLQIIWQCGKTHFKSCEETLSNQENSSIHLHEFIREMDMAYAAADVIVSRAGAIAVSELTLIGKPIVLVPSPNVAEDHQTHNAMALVNKEAAVLVKDVEAKSLLMKTVFDLMEDENKQHELAINILTFAKPNATKDIVDQIIKHAK